MCIIIATLGDYLEKNKLYDITRCRPCHPRSRALLDPRDQNHRADFCGRNQLPRHGQHGHRQNLGLLQSGIRIRGVSDSSLAPLVQLTFHGVRFLLVLTFLGELRERFLDMVRRYNGRRFSIFSKNRVIVPNRPAYPRLDRFSSGRRAHSGHHVISCFES